ncbi:hypothetical protein D3C86_1211430 [compost metagenome]
MLNNGMFCWELSSRRIEKWLHILSEEFNDLYHRLIKGNMVERFGNLIYTFRKGNNYLMCTIQRQFVNEESQLFYFETKIL